MGAGWSVGNDLAIEILTAPISYHLYGLKSAVEDYQFGAVGMRLMGELWPTLKSAGISTTGINHWVYLPDGSMFVGVEVKTPATEIPDSLLPLRFVLNRYLKHVHIGPYQRLPQTWQLLKAEMTARGEVMRGPCLEVYGHHDDDPNQLETTILIGLEQKV